MRTIALLAAALAASVASLASDTWQNGVLVLGPPRTDDRVLAPPSTGPFAYGVFGPNRAGFPARGQSYVDPVFGSTIRRLTAEFPRQSHSDVYAKNGYWNADGTALVHNDGNGLVVLDARTGSPIRRVPGDFDSSFAPDDPDVWYYWSGRALQRVSVRTGRETTLKRFAGELGPLGGSVDWIDASGRFMALNVGGVVRVWDREADVVYDGGVPAAVDGGWIGISPDGRWIVTATSPMNHHAYAIDHDARRVDGRGILFWTLCGDHGDLVSASDGRTYLVTFECYDAPAVWAVDVSLPQSPDDRDRQRAQNRRLFPTDWNDVGHFSGIAKGAWRDWAFVSIESTDDLLGRPVPAWRPYMQEIVLANVLTGEIRRLAHHRSRSIAADYYYMPRPSASWDGASIAWISNFGVPAAGYSDLYALDVGVPAEDPAPERHLSRKGPAS